MHRILLGLLLTGMVYSLHAQTETDTIKTQILSTITVSAARAPQDITRLDPVQGTYIYSGKKNEVINLSEKQVSLTEKYGRQIFSKIPGVFVYDMDGTGNQVNISTRGLDPHRGWEFNIRKDGILTNSDMYGYPASHYNLPMEAVERIELVRGTGSLQYGAQFGGMLNYITRIPDTTGIAFRSFNTIGSYGLLSTFNEISGGKDKFRFSAWINKKSLNGYRHNSESHYNAEAVSIYYDVTRNLHLKLEWTHSNYLIQLAGPLTDRMFADDPRSSTRARNYYNPDIHVPSVSLDWTISRSTQLRLMTSAVIGLRNSVLFDKPAMVIDSVVSSTQQYNHRQVDIDHFNSYTTELRILHTYRLFNHTSALTAGIQYMNNDLHRQQQGKGTTGSDYDLTLVTPGWGRDLHYKTDNVALFAENRWQLTSRFSVNTGVRMEIGETNMSGKIAYFSDDDIPGTIRHNYPLFGAGLQYDATRDMNFYAGWSQAYRPVLFKDIIPASIYEVADKQLKDAFGYNAEAGFRGRWKFLKWDLTGFHIRYNNRPGTLAQTDTHGEFTIFRTNIGDSQTSGVELFTQGDFSLSQKSVLSLFTSTSYMDARYRNAVIRVGNDNVDIDGNKVESVPAWIIRNGLTFRYNHLSLSVLHSYTAASYADALNAEIPDATGAVGLVPSYHLLDLNLGIRITSKIRLQLNTNNVLDKKYFTKRPQGYPGPGIWPSDGRTLSGTATLEI